MPRSNRRRRGAGRPWEARGRAGAARPGSGGRDDDGDAFAHLLEGTRRTEHRRGASWTVQPISAARALKTSACPGCGRAIDPGVAHVAVWRSDFVLGDDHALDGRRHWHTHCWSIA